MLAAGLVDCFFLETDRRTGLWLTEVLLVIASLLMGWIWSYPALLLHRRLPLTSERWLGLSWGFAFAAVLVFPLFDIGRDWGILHHHSGLSVAFAVFATLCLQPFLGFILSKSMPAHWRVSGRWSFALSSIFLVGFALQLENTWREESLYLVPPAGSQSAAAKPDVVLLVLDTLRADSIHKQWEGQALTPWLDEWSQTRRVYSRGYSGSMHTPPGHASLFTGLYPAENGTLNLGDIQMPDSNFALAEMLRAYGYRTLGLTSNVRIGNGMGFEQGFEIYDDSLVNSDDVFFYGPRRFFRTSLIRGIGGSALGRAGGALVKTLARGGQLELTAAQTTEATIAMLDKAALQKDEPLFLFVNYIDPHLPYYTREDLALDFQPNLNRPDLDAIRLDMVAFHHALEKLGKDLSDFEVTPDAHERLRWIKEAYWEQCRQVDEGVRDLLLDLKRRGRLSEDAIVLITADHGEHLGEHELFLHSGSIYEPLVNVPFVLQCPGLDAGHSAQPVSGVDLYPTVCAAMGIEPPLEMPGVALQGKFPIDRPIRFEARNLRGFIRGSHKWVAYDNGQRLNWAEAYDLAQDPAEMHNLMELANPPKWVAEGLVNPPVLPSEQAVEMRPVANPELMQQLGYADQVQ